MEPLQPGKCPICGDLYVERVVTPDGTEIKQFGTSVLASDRNLTVETNYREAYLILDDLSLTRVSFCSKHKPDDTQIRRIFDMGRQYIIDEQRRLQSDTAPLTIAKWERLQPVDTAVDEVAAHAKLNQLRKAKVIGKPE